MKHALPLLTVLLLCAGCAQFPDLDNALSEDAKNQPYPTLKPLAPLLEEAANSALPRPQTQANLTSRVTGLRARAAGLQRPVIDSTTRARMRKGVTEG